MKQAATKQTFKNLLSGNDEADRIQLEILLVKTRTKQTAIAEALGITPQAVNGVIARRYNIRRVLEYLENLSRSAS